MSRKKLHSKSAWNHNNASDIHWKPTKYICQAKPWHTCKRQTLGKGMLVKRNYLG